MVTLTSQSNSVKFTFTDNDHYLFGTGEIEVPINSLYLVEDESDMVTFSKIDGDPFISFRADNSNLGSKSAIETFYKNNMVGATGGGGGTGSGITSGEVQTMIDTSLEDYYDKDEIDSGFSTVNAAISAKTDNSAFTAHTANTTAHTTAAEKEAWSGKQDALVSGTNIKTINNESILGSGNITIQGGGGSGMTSGEVQTMIDASISGKTDDTDFTAHTANTTAHTTSQEKEAWDAKANMVTLAQAEYDALVSAGTVDSGTCYIISDATAFDPATKQDVLSAGTGIEISSANVISVSGMQETLVSGTNIKTINNESILGSGNITIQGGGGSGATYSAGTNISIDSENTINCTLNLQNGSATGQGSIVIAPYGTTASGNRALAGGMLSSAGAEESIAYGNNAKTNSSAGSSFALGGYVETKNKYETSLGYYNNTIKTNSTFGNSGNTLFSVGNGTSSARHNALEIRQNGDIYVNDGTNDVKLQDYLQVKVVKISQSDYDNLATKDPNTLYLITNVVS